MLKSFQTARTKALASVTSTVKALELPVKYKVHLIPSGCCWMVGSFGHEKEHFKVSMRVGELVLLPAVNSAPADTNHPYAGHELPALN
jgi:hypothetical protein